MPGLHVSIYLIFSHFTIFSEISRRGSMQDDDWIYDAVYNFESVGS